jgi:hypothetical protein
MDWKILSPLLMILQGDCLDLDEKGASREDKGGAAPTVDSRISSISASSSHSPVGHIRSPKSRPWEHVFGATMLLDGNLETCWQEGNDDTRGDGEFVVVYFKEATDLTEIRLANGCQDYKSAAGWGNLFAKNPRVQRLKVESNKGDTEYWTLQDTGGWQNLPINMKQVSNLTLTILDVYRGTEWKDASLSEISFRGHK